MRHRDPGSETLRPRRFGAPPSRRIVVASLLGAASAVALGHAGCGEMGVTGPPVHVCFAVDDPYARAGAWYRGNFHMHTSHSDGALSGGATVSLYGMDGYGVLCITDHNQWGDQDGGVVPAQTDSTVHDWNGDGVVHPQHVAGSGVEAYVRDWTRPGLQWMRDDRYRPAPAEGGAAPVVLPGSEASLGGFHIGCVGHPPGRIEAPGGGIGFIERTRRAGGFVYLAHPGEWNAVPQNLPGAIDLHPFHGLEIVNGLRLTEAFPRASAAKPDAHVAAGGDAECGGRLPWDATPLWDALLARGFRLWGLANDDSHTMWDSHTAYPFSAFNVVLAGEATPRGFLDALRNGAFYGTTGQYFGSLGVSDGELHVWAPEATSIRFVGWNGRVLAETAASRATYRFTGEEGYVRVVATGTARRWPWPARAWSQPFWLRGVSCADGTAHGLDSGGR